MTISSPSSSTTRQFRLLDLQQPNDAAIYAELRAGLLAEPSRIAPKFLYDALGSRLFAAITELPEYYPTRTEATIFATQCAEIAAAVGVGNTFIDLGAGNCEKAAGLFSALRPLRYVAVDISVEFLGQALHLLQLRHPDLDLLGIGMDFSNNFSLPSEVGSGPRVFFYPGSSIGNFTPEAAEIFLQQVHAVAQEGGSGGGLLIGVDLVKPRAVLEAAYDDALGVTAAFNRNLLRVVNRMLGADFNLADFRHVAFYNHDAHRIEMHLEARRDLTVRWPGAARHYRVGERIHTENSYKYEANVFVDLLARAGYRNTRCWTDPQGWFALFWAEA